MSSFRSAIERTAPPPSQTTRRVTGAGMSTEAIARTIICPRSGIFGRMKRQGCARLAYDGPVKTNVARFGEDLRLDFGQASEALSHTDRLFVLEPSLAMWPLAGLVRHASSRGATPIIASRDPTPHDDRARALPRGEPGEVARARGAALGWDP